MFTQESTTSKPDNKTVNWETKTSFLLLTNYWLHWY